MSAEPGSLDALLPVLVAELSDDDARRKVEALARDGKAALVPLIDPPVDTSMHVLEVTTPGFDEPLLVLAEPIGAPTEHGFPLRLFPYGAPPEERAAPSSPAGSLPALRATRPRRTTLSYRHTRDLLGEGAPPSTAPPSLAESLVGREIAGGKLVIVDMVGAGGMGVVYRARHKQLARDVAVKVLHERFRRDLAFCARFHAEALAASSLDHPNLVRIYDFGQEPDGLLYLAMELLSGEELQDVLGREGTLPLPRIVQIAAQVAGGLGHAHARGVVHRDVKPSNIVLVKADDDEGRAVELAKVCDFGIAGEPGARGLVGTPAYMSPEQCEGREVDGRSDVYALGVILYELATGQLPFSSEDPSKVVAMHLRSAPTPPSLVRPVDARLEKLVLRMLSKSPDDRPASMRQLRAELRDLSRPPSLDLFEVGAGREARTAGATSRPPPAPSIEAMGAVVSVPALAAELSREPVTGIRERLATPERIAREAQAIAGAMRLLLEMREHAALAQIVAVLRRAAESAGGVQDEIAARLVRTLEDPALLAGAAERALADDDEAAPALLASLGLAGAHALFAARARAHPTPPLRARFVAALRATGALGSPLVEAALAKNAPGETETHDPRLGEDLLRATSGSADERTGAVLARYLRWGEAAERRAAIAPLTSVWGDRARALLLAVLLKDPDEGARIAATRALRELRAIDEHVVRKLEDILGDEAAGAALRQAAAEALEAASDEARGLAVDALKRGLSRGKGKSRGPRVTGPASIPVVLAMARALAGLAGDEGAKVVEQVASATEDPLRTQLLGCIAR